MEVAASHSAVAEGLTDAAYFTLNEEKTRAGNPETVTVEGNASTVINVYYTRNVYTLNFSASGKCAMDEHDHTDDCEELVCGYTHSHNESCAKTLTCTVPVHTAHADACLICEKTEHDHTADCITCKKPDSHMHGKTCYGIAEGATSWTDPDGFLEDNHRINGSEQNGYIGAEQERSWFLGSWSNTGDEYIYYDGSWYPYTGTVAVGSIVPISCGLEEGTHNHSEAAGCYKDTEHKHSDVNGCYSDELHSHVDACYSWSCGEDPHIHTESCYAIACNKTEHTHTTGQCDVSRKQTVYTITGKYQQDIRKHFEIKNEDESVDYTGYWWQVPNNATSLVGGNYIVSLDLIPGEDLNFTGEYKGKNANLYYYTEVLSGDDYDVEYENKYFKEYKSIKTVQSGNLTYAEEFHPIKGFSQWKSNPAFNSTTSKPAIQENNYFYYARKTFKLNYYNYNADYGTAKDVLYQTSLNKAEYNIGEPSYPVGIEPDAYEFKGWYTTSGCYPGTEVDWENMTMPANDVTLYAKWVPVKHNVYFHYLYTDIDTDNDGIDENVYWYATDKNGNPLKDSEGNTIPKEYPIVVDHGALLGTTYSHIPVRNKYTFVGWFYMDADNKKRFAPDTMEVREDLHLFAEWMSGIDTQYEVTYVLKEDASVNGVLYPKGTTVAETAQGHLTAGKTKTFTAKAGYELLPTFADASLFPSTNSHSILMSEDSSENEFEFEYVVDEQVWYKIKYLDKSDNSVLHEEYVYWTNKAIITPKFEPIKGYIPEQYYIRKVLASDGATGSKDNVLPENEIIFYYTKDEDHGLYTVIYYTQNLDGTTYSQGPSRLGSDDLLVDGKPNVIKETIDSNKYTGFTPAYYTVTEYELDGDKYVAKESAKIPYTEGAVASGTLTAGGLEIRIYYDRIKYPYIIEYRQYGAKPTDPALQVIADGSEATKEMFEKEIIHKAEASFTKGDVVYEYYIDAPSDEELTKSMKIRPLTEDDPDTAENEAGNPNKLIFYYKQHQVEIQYHAVCKIPGAKDFGAVTIFSEYAATAAGIGGSTATEGVGYVFKGWYEDAACNIAVEPSWRYEPGVDENPDIQNNEGKKLKPGMLDTSLNVVKYYALFEPVTSQLTITKNVTGTERKDTFLFNIKGLGKNSYIDITVAISGNGFAVIDNIPIGEYQVTELTDWSKQYSLRNVSTADGKITVTTAPASITFTNNYEGSDWLTGEHSIINRFPQKS